MAEKFNIPYYFSSYEEMFKNIELDAVSVCTPNKFHAEVVIAALNNGCHVLCEKPPATSKADAERMTEAAKKNGKILTYNLHFRQSEEVQAVKNFIDAGEFGEIYAARVQVLRRRGIPGWGVFTNKEIQGGGPLIDIGVHMLDTALYLKDYPEVDYVSAATYDRIGKRGGLGLMGSWDPAKFTVEDSAFGFIRFKNGASLMLESSFALNIKDRSLMNVNLFGEKAGATVFPPVIYSEKHGNLIDIELPFLPEVDKRSKSIKNFIDACLFDDYEVTELPNAADVTELLIHINGEEFSLDSGKVLEYSRKLNLKDGELSREILWENNKGETYKILLRRFVSLDDLHLIGMRVEITALTAAAEISFKTGINGRQTNSGVQHFHDGDKRVYDNKYMQLIQTTSHSKIDFLINSSLKLYKNKKEEDSELSYSLERRRIYCSLKTVAPKGETIVLEKINNVFTSLDKDSYRDLEEFKRLSLDHIKKRSQSTYFELFAASQKKWADYWDMVEIDLESENDFDELAIRFAQYHLLIMTPFHDDRFSVGAKALTGEGYKGHVFWDTEIFILPYFQYTIPKIARNLLKYRFNIIEGARNKARKFGYAGAMYPWETAFTGEEETPEWAAINILTGKATRVWSALKEHHITADIAYAVWNYYLSTDDEDFMNSYGSEIIFECAEFWFRRLQWNKDKNRYEIKDLIGPDEYTEHIDNNAYTNYMTHYNF